MQQFKDIKMEMNDQPNLDRLPPPPTKPLESECCGNGCSPCVFDIYENQMKKWISKCENLQNGKCLTTEECTSLESLNPENYTDVEVTEIFAETNTMKIFRFSWEKFPTFNVQLGQHVLIRQNGISRQYTILRICKTSKTFDILIKIYEQVPDALMVS